MTDTLPFAQIDAFASKPFEGNQACVMPLESWLPDPVLQAIAAENNVAETAFIIADGEASWQLRWFTPGVEVPLCGHATLAAGHWLYQHGGYDGPQITFKTRKSGELHVKRLGDGRLEMDFPSFGFETVEIDPSIVAALGGVRPITAYAGPCLAYEFGSVADIERLAPDYKTLSKLGHQDPAWGIGNIGCFARDGTESIDVTSRFFAPGSAIDEDPATGSWHCFLASIVGADMGRTLACYQAYPGRGAKIEAELAGARVKLRGACVTVIEGAFHL